jgi:hypothetical protein
MEALLMICVNEYDDEKTNHISQGGEENMRFNGFSGLIISLIVGSVVTLSLSYIQTAYIEGEE